MYNQSIMNMIMAINDAGNIKDLPDTIIRISDSIIDEKEKIAFLLSLLNIVDHLVDIKIIIDEKTEIDSTSLFDDWNKLKKKLRNK